MANENLVHEHMLKYLGARMLFKKNILLLNQNMPPGYQIIVPLI